MAPVRPDQSGTALRRQQKLDDEARKKAAEPQVQVEAEGTGDGGVAKLKIRKVRISPMFVKVGEALEDEHKLKAVLQRFGAAEFTNLLNKVENVATILGLDISDPEPERETESETKEQDDG